MSEGPYTTITVSEYNHISSTIYQLRKKMQKARELLEKGHVATAIQILKSEDNV